MTRRLRYAARVAGRVGALVVIVAVFATVAIQFEGILAKNVAVAREVAASREQIEALRVRIADDRTTIERLRDPRGAIPEIHEKLKLVGKHEEIIYVRGLATPTPQPYEDWQTPP